MEGWIEAVPNFSEGRDLAVIDALEQAIEQAGAVLLDRTSDPDHHRSVLTFCGLPERVLAAAVAAVGVARERIDLRTHRGAHPRLGACDVLPFVPLAGASMADCVSLAHAAGQEIWSRWQIPVYFYGQAARREECAALENARRGGFEQPALAPDLGGLPLHPSAGATIVGARPVLIAYNINLATHDLAIAQRIARGVRASSGGLPHVKALGLALPSRGQVQVSMNLTNYEVTGPHTVFQAVARLAALEGVAIAGSELIGLIPRRALELAAGVDLKWENFDESLILENRIAERLRQKARARRSGLRPGQPIQ